jgi:hypothetical protein
VRGVPFIFRAIAGSIAHLLLAMLTALLSIER